MSLWIKKINIKKSEVESVNVIIESNFDISLFNFLISHLIIWYKFSIYSDSSNYLYFIVYCDFLDEMSKI